MTLARFKELWMRYESRLSSFALGIGFIIDYLTLTRIDQLFDNLVLISYLTLIAVGIVLVNFYHSVVRMKIAPAGSKREAWFLWLRTFSPVVIQFAVGGMMSGLVVFYSRSASLGGTWPFLLLLVGFMIGNEFLKERYMRLTFQISVWYFVLLSYLLFAIPMLAGQIGTVIFFISGITSLLIIALFIRIIALLCPDKYVLSKKYIVLSVGGIYCAVTLLYFFNIIPPLPLSLKDADVYYSVVREGDTYRAEKEQGSWYDPLIPGHTVHIEPGQRIYVYSAIFAPRGLTTRVVHVWKRYDESKKRWITQSRIPFSVYGGRAGGFRGYTFSDSTSEGKWRVDMTTEKGALIGRLTFTLEYAKQPVEIENVVLE